MKDDEISLVIQKLKWLRLPGMADQLRAVVQKATKENLSVLQAVDRLCDEKKASRLRNAVDRRIRDARFPEVNTVDAFDDGLTAIVQAEMGEDAYSGHLFVFVSRRRDRVEILAWDKGGFVPSGTPSHGQADLAVIWDETARQRS